MAIDKIFKNSNVDDLADNVLNEVDDFMISVDKMQQQKVAGNVQRVVQAFKKIETNITEKFDNVSNVIEKRVLTIKDGRDGINGKDGRDGKDGRNGKDGLNGKPGLQGPPGKDGIDGTDGVSVTDANIDFDGSLIINLSSGKQINVGEIISPELEKKIISVQHGGSSGSGGDVMGPTSATDNRIVRFDGTTGKLIQNSAVTLGDGGNMSGVGTLGATGLATLSAGAVIQGLTVGLGAGALDNTVFGATSLAANISGAQNTAIGNSVLSSNLTGSFNTGAGYAALVNATGNNNTGLGSAALQSATGSNNSGFGYESGYAITSGSNNVILGGYSGAAAPISATGSNWIVLSDGAGNVRQVINSIGNAGIGTTAPAAKLHVAGTTIISNVDVLNATYDSVSFSVAAQEFFPNSLFFSADGSKMFVMGLSGDDVNEYVLSTPFVVSSATYSTVFSVAAQETNPEGLFFRADGLKMYIVGRTNDTVYQYALTSPWNVATASYESISFSVATQELLPYGLFFKPDGLSMYVVGDSNESLHQYTLSTAWNVSTATFLQTLSLATEDVFPQDISFTNDGARMFVLGGAGYDVNVYDLTTPWDISTASSVGTFSIAAQETTPTGLYIKPDGTKMYVVGTANDTVFQYTVPSVEIQLTGTTSINGSATVAQDLTVNGDFNTSGSIISTAASSNSFAGGITSRVVVIADATSITVNADTTDVATQANTQAVGTLTINAPTGTPVNGQKFILRLRSTNVQTFSWNAIFQGSTDISLPISSSGATLHDYVGFIYNSTTSKWQMIAKVFGF